jgi:hypothetical protein
MEEKSVGLLEVVCNAPPYPIVQAAVAFGIERPEDCRWEPMVLNEGLSCSCGEPLPLKLPLYRFTYSTGDEVLYAVHQCNCCKRVYWNE